MSKDKRGRKCKGRHCAWCKPVKEYGTSKKWGVRPDIDVPIVKSATRPKVTVVTYKGWAE